MEISFDNLPLDCFPYLRKTLDSWDYVAISLSLCVCACVCVRARARQAHVSIFNPLNFFLNVCTKFLLMKATSDSSIFFRIE